MEDCFCLVFQLLLSSFGKSLGNKEGFERIPFEFCWQPSNAQSHIEANNRDRYSEPALIPDLKQEQHTPIYLVYRRLYNCCRNLVLQHPVFLQNSSEHLQMTSLHPEWQSQYCQIQDLCYTLPGGSILHHGSQHSAS